MSCLFKQAEWISGNVFIRPNTLEKVGDKVDGHKHNFDHTTIVFTGAVHVVKSKQLLKADGSSVLGPDGEEIYQVEVEKDFHAPAHFLVEAGARHEITAIEDGTVFWCVYSHREPQGRITEHFTGWGKAYS